ncbi:asparaginase [Pseudaestuariivita atlantica]|uniref:L-asparaginase n=1 Tax=Pseudaestuariivita atlantica TaxID=1317121 RepID=A0A0L1JQ06_9RHOB|nr:asparaginase [Pseudaestuariivita atlantica]KNG93807.1 L-asparaginase [Pseudaestuariivita atlantica]
MSHPAPMVEIWRGPFLESKHHGHAVICAGDGQVVEAWGDPAEVILPRSSAKMIQALPLLTSGAARAHGLTSEQLALACASHQGAAIHTDRVTAWLDALGLGDDALRCGPQPPNDKTARHGLIRAGETPCQVHNNCSGKHTGFLTLTRHLGAGPEYVDPDHPVQRAALAAFEETTGEASPGFGIDGCSAPNFATTMHGLARAMAWFAGAHTRSDTASRAAADLVAAMMAHPELVAGETRACTDLMRAMGGKAAIKTGAEGVFVAILPEKQMGIAVKITDGATRASECAIAALLIRLGVLDPQHPAAKARLTPDIQNWRGLLTGQIRPVAEFVA